VTLQALCFCAKAELAELYVLFVLFHFYPPVTRKRRWRYILDEPHRLMSCFVGGNDAPWDKKYSCTPSQQKLQSEK